jgi:hypothetical protein
MGIRQFSITGPAGLTLSLPTWTGGSPGYAIAGAVVVLLPHLLPYAFALYMERQGKPFTVEHYGVKINSGDDSNSP